MSDRKEKTKVYDSGFSSPYEPSTLSTPISTSPSPTRSRLSSLSSYLACFESGFSEESEEKKRKSFFPIPLNRQRHERIIQELERREHVIDTLVDFGCSKGTFLNKVRNKLQISTMIGVDIDETVLKEAEQLLDPQNRKYDFRAQNSLRLKLFRGDVAQFDRRLVHADAVVAIELIEHLYDDTLYALREVIFGRTKPYIVIITTPNVEFNVMFEMEGRPFRHEDHKFEWTRAQFQTWCDRITAKYKNYWVKYTGVGAPPADRKDIGFCTQIAIFRMRTKNYKTEIKPNKQNRNNSTLIDNNDNTDNEPYRLLYDVKYDLVITQSREESVVNECYNQCLQFIGDRKLESITHLDRSGFWIGLNDLLENRLVKKFMKNTTDLGVLLATKRWLVDFENVKTFFEYEILQNESVWDPQSDPED